MRLVILIAWWFGAAYSIIGESDVDEPEIFVLQPSDSIHVIFPGAPDLDSQLKVRRDGVITLPLVGEVIAEGKTPSQLEEELVTVYKDQLVTTEVMVSVLDSKFTFFVEGAVMSPGPIVSDRQMSVLEAVISAGGVDKANGNAKNIRVIRRQGGRYTYFRVNINDVLEGKAEEAFILQPYDIVSVPLRIW